MPTEARDNISRPRIRIFIGVKSSNFFWVRGKKEFTTWWAGGGALRTGSLKGRAGDMRTHRTSKGARGISRGLKIAYSALDSGYFREIPRLNFGPLHPTARNIRTRRAPAESHGS